MITQNEIARKDFDRVCELNDYEVFTEKQVTSLSAHIKGLIEKSKRERLSPDEVQSIHAFNEDLPELKKAIVLNDDMTREMVFYRERQVIFDEIEKSEDGDIMKARSGVYANTAQNRKAGRVGQKYGGKKAEGEEKKEDKKEDGQGKMKQGDKVKHPIHGEGVLVDFEGEEGTWMKDSKGKLYSVADSRDLKKIK